MPVEFRMETGSGNVLENTRGCSRGSVRVLMAYDGSGRRVSKTHERKEKDDETELNYFGARYLDPMLGLWISVDPKRQFASPYLYAGNGVNPVNGVDPDGNVVIAVTKQDQKIYAQFTKNLNPEQAERLSSIERDKNSVLKFHAVDGLIPVRNKYDPQKIDQILKGFVDPVEYADQNFAVAVICYTCEDAQGTFAHEVTGHGKQVLDFLNGGGITGPRTLKDAAPWIEKNKMELEKDAFEVQGTPKTDKELKDMGY